MSEPKHEPAETKAEKHKRIADAARSMYGDNLPQPQAEAAAPVSPKPPLREIVARALWNAEIAESERKEGKKNYAQWPEDASLQPYCQSTYRIADALLRELGEAEPVSAKPEPPQDVENAILRLSAVLGGDYAEGCFTDAEVINEAGEQLQKALHELAEAGESLSAQTEHVPADETCDQCGHSKLDPIHGSGEHAGRSSASPRMPEGQNRMLSPRMENFLGRVMDEVEEAGIDDEHADGEARPPEGPVNANLLAACKMALGAFESNHAIDWGILQRAIEDAELLGAARMPEGKTERDEDQMGNWPVR